MSGLVLQKIINTAMRVFKITKIIDKIHANKAMFFCFNCVIYQINDIDFIICKLNFQIVRKVL